MHTPPPKTLAINWNPWSRALQVLSRGHGFLNLPNPSVNVFIRPHLRLEHVHLLPRPWAHLVRMPSSSRFSFRDKFWGPVKCLGMTGRFPLTCQHTLTVFFKAQSNYWKSYKAFFVLPKKKCNKSHILSNSTHTLLFFLVININQQQCTADSPITCMGKGK